MENQRRLLIKEGDLGVVVETVTKLEFSDSLEDFRKEKEKDLHNKVVLQAMGFVTQLAGIGIVLLDLNLLLDKQYADLRLWAAGVVVSTVGGLANFKFGKEGRNAVRDLKDIDNHIKSQKPII